MTLLSEVRKQQIPVAFVLITGQGDEGIAVAALKAGADEYITKKKDYLKELPDALRKALDEFQTKIQSIKETIGVLYAEHNTADIDLTKRYLDENAPNIHLTVVGSAREILEMVRHSGLENPVDVILADFSLPDMNSKELLAELQKDPNFDTPVVVITGQGNEDTAVQMLKMGAMDYLVKSTGYLFRLPAVLENAHNLVRLQQEKEALKESESKFRLLAENAQDLIFRYEYLPKPGFSYVSPSALQLTGYTPEEYYADPQLGLKSTHPEDRHFIEKLNRKDKIQEIFDVRMTRKDGTQIWVGFRQVPIYNGQGELESIEGIIRDITAGKKAETHLKKQMDKISSLHLIDKAITSSFDLRVTYQVLLDQVRQTLECDSGAILTFDADTNGFKYAAGVGFSTGERELQEITRNSPLATGAVISRKSVYEDLESKKFTSAQFMNFIQKENFKQYWCAPMIVKGQTRGVLEVYQRSRIEPDFEWTSFLEALAQQAAIALDNSINFDGLRQSHQELLQAYDETLMGWIQFLDLRDEETEGHTLRVLDWTIKVAYMFGIKDEEMANVRRGAILHDIGKVGVPDSILNKPGPLTDEEWVIMRKHPVFAYEMLSQIAFLRPALTIPYCHHEKWDGSGYPRNLKGKEIPLPARIFAIVDVFDALTSDRPYRKAWKVSDAIDHIRKGVGTHFDPDLVEVCLATFSEGE